MKLISVLYILILFTGKSFSQEIHSYSKEIILTSEDMNNYQADEVFDFFHRNLISEYTVPQRKSGVEDLEKDQRIMYEYIYRLFGSMTSNFDSTSFNGVSTNSKISFMFGAYRIFANYKVTQKTSSFIEFDMNMTYSGGMDSLFWILSNIFQQKYALVNQLKIGITLDGEQIKMNAYAQSEKGYKKIYFENIVKKFIRFARKDLSLWVDKVVELYPEEEI